MIKKTNKIIRYETNIESMGKGLVMLEVKAKCKRVGFNYHYYFENGIKPPLDFAINPESNMIEYVTFFIQDEIVKTENPNCDIEFCSTNIIIEDGDFSENFYEKNIHKEFDVYLYNRAIYIIEKNIIGNIVGYELNKSVMILINSNNKFSGIIIRIGDEELNILKHAEVLV